MESIFGSARWISSSVIGGKLTSPPVPFFRKPFTLSQPVRAAKLTITALGIYEAEINGAPIGDHIFAPGWTDYAKRVQYQTYDVAAHLRRGENVLGAILGDGWYCGALGWSLYRQVYGPRPQLLARLEIVLRDGSKVEIGTDLSWKTAIGPILESDFLAGESYDARLELGNWSRPGYDDKGWEPVLAAPTPKIEYVISDAPPVRRLGELKPVARIKGQGRFYDLKQNFTGRVRVKVKAPRGTTLRIKFAEILNPDGSLYTENLRGARATDTYTCKGGGTETWEPRFTFHGFRHVEVWGPTEKDEVEITGVVLHSDTPRTGYFACSHKLLNQLQHNIEWGQKSNFLEVPTDCPQRDERLGWTGDAQVFIRTAAFNMDVRGFFHKWTQDIRDAQSKAGGVPPVVPKVVVMDIEDAGPAWSDAAVICPWTIYLCYGDKKILKDHYEAMVRYVDFLKKQALKYIRSHPDADVFHGFGDWLALDGSGKLEGQTPKDLIGTSYFAYDADIVARTAEILGHKEDAKRFRDLRAKIVAAFQRRFLTADGLLASPTQTSMVMALHFDMLPERVRPAIAKALAKDVEQRGFHLATGFVGTSYVPFVLERFGYLETAYKLLEQETFPSWLFPIKNGATTIWERWDGWTHEKGPGDKSMNSFNHYAYGAVGEWMTRSVAGLDLDPEQPGYKHIIFRPRLGGTLTWAEAELKTGYGKTAIRWEKTKAGLKLDLTVPPKTRATLDPPEGFGKPRKLGPGRHRITLKKTGKQPTGGGSLLSSRRWI